MARLFLVAALGLLLASPALAQGNLGVGGQVGDPTGVTVRIGSTGSAVDIAVGWNLSNNRIFAQAHYIPGQIALGAAPAALRLFYGPGLFIGAGGSGNDEATFGVSFNAGLSLWTGPLEFFGQLTPRLQLIDETAFQLGGAAGLRYYF